MDSSLGNSVLFFPAITGFLGVVLGIWWDNKQNNERLEMQHEFELNKIEKERNASMIREVYIEAAANMANGGRYIMGFVNQNLNESDHSKLLDGFSKSINKIHLVGSYETVKSITEVSHYLTIASLDLFKQKLPITEKQNNINYINKEYVDKTNLLDWLYQRLNNLGNTPLDINYKSIISNDIQLITANREQLLERKNQIENEIKNCYLRMYEKVMKHNMKLGELIEVANVNVRKEIKLSLPEIEDYRKMMKELRAQIGVAHKDFIKDLFQTVE